MFFKSYPYLLCGLFLLNAVPAHAEETQPNNDTKSIQTAADHGDAQAQYHLGMIYLDGQKVKQDSVAAREWITKAAQQGYTDAEAQLGEMNILGQGFANDVENDQKKNYEAAKEWLDKASAKGSAKANYWLGNVHNDTQNAMQSAQETFTHYQDAAKKSYDQAHSKVTDMYEAGSKSVSQDSAKARDWFQQAANQGNMTAQGYMADMYRFGTGGPVDTQKAKSMYEKLCQEGQKKACDSYKDIEEKGK